jgi:hypothetical protein
MSSGDFYRCSTQQDDDEDINRNNPTSPWRAKRKVNNYYEE